MDVGSENRPLMPHQNSMPNYSFAPPNMGVPTDKKSEFSLLVDEAYCNPVQIMFLSMSITGIGA